jgi:hypothetical protein
MWRRVVCALLGSFAGTLAGLLLDVVDAPKVLRISATSVVGVLGMAVALRYGERTGVIPSREEANRLITLFNTTDRK